MDKNPLIELKQVSHIHPDTKTPLFENINLSVDKSKIGLIGSNGSGKTTLLHMLVGLISPQSGELYFKGKIVQSRQQLRELRKEIGLVFQDSDDQLFLPTVIEDVAFGLVNNGIETYQAIEQAKAILESLKLSHLAEKVTWKLSGGEKKLVSLATILVMNPKLILLDEPTNSLDQLSREKLINILNDLEIPLLIVSHDWDFLSKTTQQVFAFEDGKLSKNETSILHPHYHAHPLGKQPHTHK